MKEIEQAKLNDLVRNLHLSKEPIRIIFYLKDYNNGVATINLLSLIVIKVSVIIEN